MPAPYDPKAIANYFLAKSDGLSQMKLQKLLYYAQGWNLAIRRTPLFNEHVEAWEYGPVVPSIYHEFKRFGAGPIDGKATVLDGSPEDPRLVAPNIDPDDADTRKLLDRMWEVYGGFSAIELSRLTHQPGAPWSEVREMNRGMKGADIPMDLIREHFESRLAANG